MLSISPSIKTCFRRNRNHDQKICLSIIILLSLVSCNEKQEINNSENQTYHDMIRRFENEISKDNWSQAGAILFETKEKSEEESIYLLDQKTDTEDRIIDALIEERVFTKEDTQRFINGDNFIVPEKPIISILDQPGELVLEWFKTYREWMLHIASIPDDSFYEGKNTSAKTILYMEDSLDELSKIRKNYMAEGSDYYPEHNIETIKIGKYNFYWIEPGGFGLLILLKKEK